MVLDCGPDWTAGGAFPNTAKMFGPAGGGASFQGLLHSSQLGGCSSSYPNEQVSANTGNRVRTVDVGAERPAATVGTQPLPKHCLIATPAVLRTEVGWMDG